MKKILFFILTFFVTTSAYADWSVTVTWTKSVGPNLDKEIVRMDGASKCVVKAGQATKCIFNVTELKGQKIEVISSNIQGAENGFVVGTLFEAPKPATGGFISIHWFEP